MNRLKELTEKRNAIVESMKAITGKATTENRAVSTEESAEFDKFDAELRSLDDTIKMEERARDLSLEKVPAEAEKKESKEEVEVRSFENFVRSRVSENRADVNMTTGDNGAIVPATIANKIITKVLEISPIFATATRYMVKGTLSIPYYDETANAITVAYADEFVDGESKVGKMASITLNGFLARALVKLSKSLQNNSQFDVVSFVINDMAKQYALWIDGELINGTVGKVTGLSTATQTVTTALATAITADELIDVQEKVPDIYQANAFWVMSKATRTYIRKFKDGQGNYLLQKDSNAKWGYTLFGKDVFVSAKCNDIAATKRTVFYGDFTGLAVKVSEDINIQVLNEVYAGQHVVGILGFLEMDSKVEDQQKISVLVQKA